MATHIALVVGEGLGHQDREEGPGGLDRRDLDGGDRGGRGEGQVARDEARAAHTPVGPREADYVAARRGTTDRAARVRAERAVGEPGGERRGRAAGGATGHVLEAPRVLRRLEAVAWELE